MTIRALVHTLPMPTIFAKAKQFPAVATAPAAVSLQAWYRPAPPARLEMRWQITASGPVFRWEACQTASRAEAAGEPVPEEWSSLAVAI